MSKVENKQVTSSRLTPYGVLNQCDGCRRGLPITNGMHDLTGEVGSYPSEKMWCTKELYEDESPWFNPIQYR